MLIYFEKNQSIDSAIRDLRNALVDAERKKAALLTELDNLKTEHACMKRYLVEKTNKAIKKADNAELHVKKYTSGFTYCSGEAQGKHISRQKCKPKYSVPNPMTPSLTLSLVSEKKISSFHIEFYVDLSPCFKFNPPN